MGSSPQSATWPVSTSSRKPGTASSMARACASLARYETIGVGYRRHRRPEPRVAARIINALGDAHRIVDVGSGTGSYEPENRVVVAFDASAVMLGEHPGPRRVRGAAEHLPFRDSSFDA